VITKTSSHIFKIELFETTDLEKLKKLINQKRISRGKYSGVTA
jgi:hypothetical protein